MALTINDIARELNLSKATVSKVMNGKGKISQETRDRVLNWIEANGFTPDYSAKILSSKKTFNIGIVLPVLVDNGAIPFFQELLLYISSALAEKNYDVVVIADDGEDTASLERVVSSSKVDGIILTRVMQEDRAVSYLKEKQVPFVVIGSQGDSNVFQLDVDHRKACKELSLEFLRDKDCFPNVLCGSLKHNVNKNRMKGLLDACKEKGIRVEESRIMEDVNAADINSTHRIIEGLFESGPSAFICFDDMLCLDLVLYLRENRNRIKSKISIASFYNNKMLKYIYEDILVLDVSTESIGQKAAAMILDLIDGKECSHNSLLEYSIVRQ